MASIVQEEVSVQELTVFSKALVASFKQDFEQNPNKVQSLKKYFMIRLQLADLVAAASSETIKIPKRKWKFLKYTNSEENIVDLSACLASLNEDIQTAFDSVKEDIDPFDLKLKVLSSVYSKMVCKTIIRDELQKLL
jgi:hypothetical protein